MSAQLSETRTGIRNGRFAFAFLLAIGLFLAVWGLVGPITTWAAFSEVFVDKLGLAKEPETYTKITMLYADHEARRGALTTALGLLILAPAGFGLWILQKLD